MIPGADNNAAIRLACDQNRTEAVRLLLADPRVDPCALDNYALSWAAIYGNVECIKLLITHPRICLNNIHLINWSSMHNQIEIIKILLADPCVDIAYMRNHAIRTASKWGHHELVSLLLDHFRYSINIHDYIRIKSKISPAINEIWVNHIIKYKWCFDTFLAQHLIADLGVLIIQFINN